MKTFNVFTHYDVVPLQIEAATKGEALAAGIAARTANPPVIAGGYRGMEYADQDGPAWVPARPAKELEQPFACVARKPRFA